VVEAVRPQVEASEAENRTPASCVWPLIKTQN
jgi:hypothetical protein